MPNCDFFAAGEDHPTISDWVFSRDDCTIYEAYSELDETLKRFGSTHELKERFAISTSAVHPDRFIFRFTHQRPRQFENRADRLETGKM